MKRFIMSFTSFKAYCLLIVAVIVISTCGSLALEYKPGERRAEELFNRGIGEPWRGGNPPPSSFGPINVGPIFQWSDGIWSPYDNPGSRGYYIYDYSTGSWIFMEGIYYHDFLCQDFDGDGLCDSYAGPTYAWGSLSQGDGWVYPEGQGPTASTTLIPAVSIVDHSMARTIATTGLPVGRTASFSAGEPRAYSWIRFGPVYEAHRLRWRWYSPDGALYTESVCQIPAPSTRGLEHWYSPKYWSQLSILGTSAAQLPGAWSVEFSVDDRIMLVERFTILS